MFAVGGHVPMRRVVLLPYAVCVPGAFPAHADGGSEAGQALAAAVGYGLRHGAFSGAMRPAVGTELHQGALRCGNQSEFAPQMRHGALRCGNQPEFAPQVRHGACIGPVERRHALRGCTGRLPT
ncbi:hypothetical protein GCM10009740_04630 [Terrabacter terrae]|uniref:Secreted protein n=1 Tax=Terrabacter terrae TaxID=318434 RepID=A0ABN2TSA8_9MICO